MRFKALATLLISLIGFYSIFSAILIAGMPLLLLVMAPFQGDGIEYVGFTTLMCIPQFVLLFLLGLFLIRKAPRLGEWMLARAGVAEEQEAGGMSLQDLSFLCFSLLGLYMLSTTVPDGLRTLAAWFQAKAAETQMYSGISSDGFWRQRFPELIYHAAAIGFASFVFIRGRSIGRFVASLRSAGTRSSAEKKIVQPARPDNAG
jgi:hypothetical protein